MKTPSTGAIRYLELATVAASLIGILLAIAHGNLYDYFLKIFSIPGVIYLNMLYASLLLYSCLAFVVFLSFFLLNVKNGMIRLLNYIQGGLALHCNGCLRFRMD